jgi:hypothetical protein
LNAKEGAVDKRHDPIAAILPDGTLSEWDERLRAAGATALYAGNKWPASGPSHAMRFIKVLQMYARFHDKLSEMIENGRLKEADIPDDYKWLANTLAALAAEVDQVLDPNDLKPIDLQAPLDQWMTRALELLGETLERWEGEEDSVKEEKADHIADLKAFLEDWKQNAPPADVGVLRHSHMSGHYYTVVRTTNIGGVLYATPVSAPSGLASNPLGLSSAWTPPVVQFGNKREAFAEAKRHGLVRPVVLEEIPATSVGTAVRPRQAWKRGGSN